MKKIFISLIFIISFLCFSNSINALDCKYEYVIEDEKNSITLDINYANEMAKITNCQYSTNGTMKKCDNSTGYYVIQFINSGLDLKISIDPLIGHDDSLQDSEICPVIFANSNKHPIPDSSVDEYWILHRMRPEYPGFKLYELFPNGFIGGTGGNENPNVDLECILSQQQESLLLKEVTFKLIKSGENYYYSVYKYSGEYIDTVLFYKDANPVPGGITYNFLGSEVQISMAEDTKKYYYDILNNGACPPTDGSLYIYRDPRLYHNFVISHSSDINPDWGFGDNLEYTFDKYIYALINPLKAKSVDTLDYEISIWDKYTRLKDIQPTNDVCDYSTCLSDPDYYLNIALTDTLKYCTDVFANREDYTMAFTDCISFKILYKKLITDGIIEDPSYGCNFISNELGDKLVWILDLLKIVGPIAALGLGSLDFIKAVASGDADKEMKTAFKRFSTRIIAAVLLFIVPFILAFLMDTFLGNEEGYNPDNPFCNIVEWE